MPYRVNWQTLHLQFSTLKNPARLHRLRVLSQTWMGHHRIWVGWVRDMHIRPLRPLFILPHRILYQLHITLLPARLAIPLSHSETLYGWQLQNRHYLFILRFLGWVRFWNHWQDQPRKIPSGPCLSSSSPSTSSSSTTRRHLSVQRWRISQQVSAQMQLSWPVQCSHPASHLQAKYSPSLSSQSKYSASFLFSDAMLGKEHGEGM